MRCLNPIRSSDQCCSCRGRGRRRAVTVLEVLFATGIVIFGLIGIASLIGVAGRQASDANRSTEGQAYAQSWYAEFLTRGFNDHQAWRWYDDQRSAGNRFRVYDISADIPRGTSTTAVPNRRRPFRHAVCIDPSFFAEPLTLSYLAGTTFSNNQPFRPGLFPYFQDDWDPTSGVAAATFPGPNHARLLRVSLGQLGMSGVLPAKLVDDIFVSRDDLSISADEDDETLPPQRLFRASATTAGVPSHGLENGAYSWFATVSPREFGASENLDFSAEEQYLLSIVVCHRRDAVLDLSGGEVPQGERLTSVISPNSTPAAPAPPSNFVGGSGGLVQLVGSLDFEASMTSGDWVMLAREQRNTAGNYLGTICRWYRIISTDAEPVEDPASGMWVRNVVLDGPDWLFTDGSGTSTETQATIVNDVVTVLERVITIE